LRDGGFDRLSHRVSGTIMVAELVEATRSSELDPVAELVEAAA